MSGKFCKQCGRKANASGYCDKHESAARWYEKYPVIFPRKKGKRNTWKLAGNQKWSRLSKMYLSTHYTCVRCDTAAEHVDHVYPVSRYPNLAFRADNFQSLCSACHRFKTLSLEVRGLYPNWRTSTLHFDKKVTKIKDK